MGITTSSNVDELVDIEKICQQFRIHFHSSSRCLLKKMRDLLNETIQLDMHKNIPLRNQLIQRQKIKNANFEKGKNLSNNTCDVKNMDFSILKTPLSFLSNDAIYVGPMLPKDVNLVIKNSKIIHAFDRQMGTRTRSRILGVTQTTDEHYFVSFETPMPVSLKFLEKNEGRTSRSVLDFNHPRIANVLRTEGLGRGGSAAIKKMIKKRSDFVVSIIQCLYYRVLLGLGGGIRCLMANTNRKIKRTRCVNFDLYMTATDTKKVKRSKKEALFDTISKNVPNRSLSEIFDEEITKFSFMKPSQLQDVLRKSDLAKKEKNVIMKRHSSFACLPATAAIQKEE